MTKPVKSPVEIINLYQTNFPIYAQCCLKIQSKSGKIESFGLNRAQQYVHEQVESQLAKIGKIRAIILKGRQQGISTYVEARLYWKTSGSFGRRAYVLAHEQAASDNLFGMAQRYHDHAPKMVKPHTGTANAKELYFDRLNSGYKVTTAGSKATGRSGTAQLLHGSEVAFWDKADEHMAGIGQTVPDLPGTEIFLESTANGLNNVFHEMWQMAVKGESDYLPIFVPWFWQPEYRSQVPADFVADELEAVLADTFRLDDQQLVWRRRKINTDFKGDVSLFQQEYPCTPAEAFRCTGGESLISPFDVMRARSHKVTSEYGPVVIGVDPARFGKDRTAIAFRRGRKVSKVLAFRKLDTMQVAGVVGKIINEENPAMVFIDVGGLGAGVVDRLNELGYGPKITAVNFGSKANMEDKYHNLRSQMWGELRDWFVGGGVEIPDSDSLHADVVGPSYKYDSLQRINLESKDEMKARGVKSPDEGDALALTFAAPVANTTDTKLPEWRERLRKMQQSETSTMAA